MKTSEKKENMLRYLENLEGNQVKKMKRTLIANVPYRLQAPFLKNMYEQEWKVSYNKLVEKINSQNRLIYYFKEYLGIMTYIRIQPEWCKYFIDNQIVINGWIQYNLIIYLQRRNPNVPGISSKLEPPQTRRLNRVIQYWKTIMEITPIKDIYGVFLVSNDVEI